VPPVFTVEGSGFRFPGLGFKLEVRTEAFSSSHSLHPSIPVVDEEKRGEKRIAGCLALALSQSLSRALSLSPTSLSLSLFRGDFEGSENSKEERKLGDAGKVCICVCVGGGRRIPGCPALSRFDLPRPDYVFSLVFSIMCLV
jgi:hypothetical protein